MGAGLYEPLGSGKDLVTDSNLSTVAEDAIRRGLDVLIGTPGRILDHMNKGNLNLGKLR